MKMLPHRTLVGGGGYETTDERSIPLHVQWLINIKVNENNILFQSQMHLQH